MSKVSINIGRTINNQLKCSFERIKTLGQIKDYAIGNLEFGPYISMLNMIEEKMGDMILKKIVFLIIMALLVSILCVPYAVSSIGNK